MPQCSEGTDQSWNEPRLCLPQYVAGIDPQLLQALLEPDAADASSDDEDSDAVIEQRYFAAHTISLSPVTRLWNVWIAACTRVGITVSAKSVRIGSNLSALLLQIQTQEGDYREFPRFGNDRSGRRGSIKRSDMT